ncbi:CpaF family protein [Methanosphaera sp. WGK6]|uniref:CpaF family protein n=1 Tax=Methanosphaera sp. WGK6 TaxID=1561964 RepID=UPI00084BDB5D|nr:ATPase, T2SS/T4P/T4SS family [Methanosphaera sp. WGK6]OED30445.1 secretion protein [Methanosphaera sp. WGK6]
MKEKKYLPTYTSKKIPSLNNEEFKLYNEIKEKLIKSKIQENNLIIEKTELYNIINDHTTNENIKNKLLNDLKGHGEIDNLLRDDALEEIMIIGPNKPIYVYHRTKGMMLTDIILKEPEIRQIIEKIANNIQRKIDKQTPLLDARLEDNSRINATIPPLTPDGPTLTIRKFRKDPYNIINLINMNTITSELAAFLWVVIEGLNVKPSNILISGGTGSGKTTTLNTLTSFIPPHERIITIEDTLELQIPHDHIIRTETKPPNIENKGEITMNLLLKNSLRQRPDRIIIGEVRSKEAITLFSALNTGHSGMGTLHSNSAQETITRLINPPMNVPNIMINSIDFIIMQNRIYHPQKGVVRRITEVAEIVGMETDKIQLNKIFEYDPNKDNLTYDAIHCNALEKIATLSGISYNDINNEIKKRKKYLENFIEETMNIQEYINNYYPRNDSENIN